MSEIIKNIEEVHDFKIEPVHAATGAGGRLGMIQMINAISGYSQMSGYKVETNKHVYHVLIDNEQSCCENWGYMTSEDDLNNFIGTKLREVRLTDTALNQARIDDKLPWGLEAGAIQFVDFVTDKGVFQIAVYNEHNGYYGHGIVIAKDDGILLKDVL